jgi:dihydropteroate synthase
MLSLDYLADLYARFPDAARAPLPSFVLGGRSFDFNTDPAILGVINLSPDSWYRESVCLTAEKAIERGLILQAQGADFVDIGAESTLAHASRLDAANQAARIVPVVQRLRQEGVLVSVETYLPQVTEECLRAGANILNLTGQDPSGDLFRVAAAHGAGVIICFVAGENVREVTDLPLNSDPIPVLYDYFARQIERATALGLEKIFIDPGLGFYYRNLQDSALRVQHQMRVFLNSFRLRSLGFPICQALPHAFEFFGEEVRSAESFFAVLACLGRASVFRTHEVPKVKAVLDTLRAFKP